jgi:hypothetical protein
LTEKRKKRDEKKGGEKGGEGEKVAERKTPNMHLLEARKLMFKCGVRLTEKSARRARKVTERKMDNMQLLEVCKVKM